MLKISCTHENLLKTLNYLEWVVGRQSHLPILSNILFEAADGRLCLYATNLEIGVKAELGAKVEGDGKIVLPAKLLHQFVQNLNQKEVVVFSQEGTRVMVENGQDEISMNTMESKDFPLIPEYTGEYPIKLPAQELVNTLRKVLFAASTNESRVELTGVFFSASERGIHVVATDSFRLAEATFQDVHTASQEQFGVFLRERGGIILPIDTLQELLRIIQDGDGEVALAIEDNQAFFEIDGVRLVSRVIQGRYPDYHQILPKEFQFTVAVPKAALVRALKMATGFAQYGSSEVHFRFLPESSSLELSTSSTGVGEQRTKIPLEDGVREERDIVFQPRHVLEGVNALEGEIVHFHINTKDMPVLLTGSDPKWHLYLVMPIRK